MGVQFVQDAEKQRLAKRKMVWDYFTGTYDEVITYARGAGWKEKRVQVKSAETETGTYYYVEPYEEDCQCPSLVPYFDVVIDG